MCERERVRERRVSERETMTSQLLQFQRANPHLNPNPSIPPTACGQTDPSPYPSSVSHPPIKTKTKLTLEPLPQSTSRHSRARLRHHDDVTTHRRHPKLGEVGGGGETDLKIKTLVERRRPNGADSVDNSSSSVALILLLLRLRHLNGEGSLEHLRLLLPKQKH